MQLASNWRVIIARAWSVRLMILAGLLSGLEASVGMFPGLFEALQISQGYAAAASMTITCLALWARLIAQSGVTNAE